MSYGGTYKYDSKDEAPSENPAVKRVWGWANKDTRLRDGDWKRVALARRNLLLCAKALQGDGVWFEATAER